MGKKFLVNAAAGLLTALTLLVLLELGLRFFSPWERSWAKTEGSPQAFRLNAFMRSRLAETVRSNAEQNQLLSADPELLFRGRPNPTGAVIQCHEGINSRGFRGPEWTGKAGGLRILVLGDSCAYGFQICESKRTIAAVLDRVLRRNRVPAEIYNLSVPGYSTTQARIVFEKWKDIIKPQAVIFYLGWNDLWPSPFFTDLESIGLLRELSGERLDMLRTLSIYRHLESLFILFRGKDKALPGHKGTTRVSMAEGKENWRKLLEGASAVGAKSYVIPPPYFSGAPRSLEFMGPYQKFLEENLAKQADIILLQDKMDSAGYFQRDGFHPNAEGAALIAQELAKIITRDFGRK